MVVDSPPHQSKLVIQWVKDNLKKPISHLLVHQPMDAHLVWKGIFAHPSLGYASSPRPQLRRNRLRRNWGQVSRSRGLQVLLGRDPRCQV
jgi:hypothetical protein